MGIGGSSLNIPGGGTEGYHVLKVNIKKKKQNYFVEENFKINYFLGSR